MRGIMCRIMRRIMCRIMGGYSTCNVFQTVGVVPPSVPPSPGVPGS